MTWKYKDYKTISYAFNKLLPINNITANNNGIRRMQTRNIVKL